MPEAASTVAQSVDDVYYFILYLSLIFFVGIVGTMVYFAFKYKKKSENDKTSPISHSAKLEIWWSAIPTVLLVVMFVWGFRVWMDMQVVPANALELRVTAYRWNWTFDYPKEGIVSDNLVVPVDTPIKLVMTASPNDVIHSFSVPAFPGR